MFEHVKGYLVSPYIHANEHWSFATTRYISHSLTLQERIGRLVLAILECIPIVNYFVEYIDKKLIFKKTIIISPTSNKTPLKTDSSCLSAPRRNILQKK